MGEASKETSERAGLTATVLAGRGSAARGGGSEATKGGVAQRGTSEKGVGKGSTLSIVVLGARGGGEGDGLAALIALMNEPQEGPPDSRTRAKLLYLPSPR